MANEISPASELLRPSRLGQIRPIHSSTPQASHVGAPSGGELTRSKGAALWTRGDSSPPASKSPDLSNFFASSYRYSPTRLFSCLTRRTDAAIFHVVFGYAGIEEQCDARRKTRLWCSLAGKMGTNCGPIILDGRRFLSIWRICVFCDGKLDI